ncbi:MAG: hypothetical protein AAF449_00415 [Myxococcota bacterium]
MKTKKKSKSRTIELSNDMHRKLRILAAHKDMELEEVVEMLLSNCLDQKRYQPPRDMVDFIEANADTLIPAAETHNDNDPQAASNGLFIETNH